MTRKWNYPSLSSEEQRIGAELARRFANCQPLADLLVQRGITTIDAAERFFHPSVRDLHDPFLMPDMDKAVERLNHAMGSKEKIMVYGDYDVDGCTAVALV
ncbi:MAG: single-stranded-DNA-specific exonuclease RecJ, partial [Muribaculaceae bacterium]|nr:single-stranded-DNA-specific exonuclease RecJ [Muribaculaceae bacterium]